MDSRDDQIRRIIDELDGPSAGYGSGHRTGVLRRALDAERDAAALTERERGAKLADAKASEIREAEFVGPREAAEALRDVAADIRAGT